jgi:hypothetical protein
MAQAVARLGARRERIPAVAAGHAGENDRANVNEGALALAVLEQKRAARDEAGSFDGGIDGLDRHAGRRFLQSKFRTS